jgi:outer membrane biosynthesis protein TonB
MMRKKLTAGIAAFGIYFTLLALLLYYFGYQTRAEPKHFVAKKEKGITVTLAGARPPAAPKATPRKAPKKKRHPKPRNVSQTKKAPPKTPAKKKVSPRKRPDTKKLFGGVKPPKKSPAKPAETQRKSGAKISKKRSGESIKKPKRESGVENAYLARVERALRDWPAQANFAGQEIDVWLKIYPSGNFEFKVMKLSGNPDFNHELINYLKQLQRIGFGPHKRGRPYEIEVQFVAHE